MTETTNTPSLADIENQELRATGQDIPDGSYGATLFGFTEPFWMPVSEQFRKPGQPEKRLCFDARFGFYDKAGQLTELTYLMPVPDGGAANRKSNLYKVLKALSAGNVELINAEGNIPKGVKLASFVGRSGVLSVIKNKKDWPQISSVSPRMDGIKYPTVEECKANLKGSDGTPF